MLKFNLIVSDPPWYFSDKLTMSDTKRGAESQYSGIMKDKEIIDLPIENIAADDSLFVLWVPSAKLQLGLDHMKKCGFEQKQTWVWVKIKNQPLKVLGQSIRKLFKNLDINEIIEKIHSFDLNDSLKFYMGRTFRQTHELALIGTRGKIYKQLENKSQISVFMGNNLRHSEKPEELQDRLDIMFPNVLNKIELFARRQRKNYICVGNESPMTPKEDINISLEKLNRITNKNANLINKYIAISDDKSNKKLSKIWENI